MTEYDEEKEIARKKERELVRKYGKTKEKLKRLEMELANYGYVFNNR